MTAGVALTRVQVDGILTACAVQLRNACNQIRIQYTPIAQLGVAGLEGLPAGQGGVVYSPADALDAITKFEDMAQVASLYYGLATQATAQNFDQALSSSWAGT